jgi:hypothetical protein
VSDLILDDLELELRKLPGVRAAGFDARDDLLIVQLHVISGAGIEGSLPVAATRIAARHADRPVAVEVVRWRDTPPAAAIEAEPAAPAAAPSTTGETESAPAPVAPAGDAPAGDHHEATARMRLLAVLSFPDTDELEVHLILDGRRTIGRAPASRGLVAALDATLGAVRDFGFPVDPAPRWARALETTDNESLVAVALDESGPGDHVLYGVASGATPIDAAARATLAAINRKTTR